jgi:bacteriocin-like protein
MPKEYTLINGCFYQTKTLTATKLPDIMLLLFNLNGERNMKTLNTKQLTKVSGGVNFDGVAQKFNEFGNNVKSTINGLSRDQKIMIGTSVAAGALAIATAASIGVAVSKSSQLNAMKESQNLIAAAPAVFWG